MTGMYSLSEDPKDANHDLFLYSQIMVVDVSLNMQCMLHPQMLIFEQ